jgi:acetyl-CoA acyltransferase 1
MGYGPGGIPSSYSDQVLAYHLTEECLLPMGVASENVAAEFGVTRPAPDMFAACSFQNAAAPQKAGKSKVTVKGKDASETQREVLVDADYGIRDGVTAESLAMLKPALCGRDPGRMVPRNEQPSGFPPSRCWGMRLETMASL